MNVSFDSFRLRSLLLQCTSPSPGRRNLQYHLSDARFDVPPPTLARQLIRPKCCIRAGDVLGGGLDHLKATDSRGLNFSPSVPLTLSLLRVSLEQDEAIFFFSQRRTSDSFYNEGLINGSQASNPLPSSTARRLMRKWERSFVAGRLCGFLQQTGKRSADDVSDPCGDSRCRFTESPLWSQTHTHTHQQPRAHPVRKDNIQYLD